MPCNREENRGVEQDAKIISTVRVLPQVISIHDKKFPERLLEAGMELVTLAGTNRSRRSTEDRVNEGIPGLAGKNQVLVERGFHDPRVRGTQNGIAGLDSVGDANARLGLGTAGKSAVEITTKAQVERPATYGN